MTKNKITTLCLSGWAQKPDSLQVIFDNFAGYNFEVHHFDYSRFNNVDQFFSEVKKLKIDFDLVFGWSLGGQLSARLTSAKIVDPKLLILMGAPFQFVKSPRIIVAMPEEKYKEFHDHFALAPDNALRKFSILSMINDKNSRELLGNLQITDQNHANILFWLEELGRFSCYDLDFSDFPETLIIQGEGDVVVHPLQAKIFAEKIAKSDLKTIKNCGHAPHFNNLGRVQEIIFEKIDSIYK